MEQIQIGALVIAFTQLIKRWIPNNMHDKVMPIIAVVIAILLVTGTSGLTNRSLMDALIIGLAASGLYSAAKDIAS